MQLQKWTTVNKRYFAPGSRPSQEQWKTMIRNGVINGRILGTDTYVDVDQLAASVELSQSRNDMPNLLG